MQTDLEQDKLTQIYVNTQNVKALVDQLKFVQAEQQVNVDKIHKLEIQVTTLTNDLNSLRQILLVMRAMSLGSGPTQ
jgi:hypothetical protein